MPRSHNDPRRVVEEPRRSFVPYLAAAAIGALAIWTFQQRAIEDSARGGSSTAPVSRQRSERAQAGARGAMGDLRTLFSANDYPADAQRNGDEGTVQAELAIDARGRVSGCTIVRSSGHETLDRSTCNILQRRARFKPALDVNGNAVPTKVTTPPVVWRLEG